MKRVGYVSLVLAALAVVAARVVERALAEPIATPLGDLTLQFLVVKGLTLAAVALAAYGVYLVVAGFLVARAADKRRKHDVRNVVKLAVGGAALAAGFGVVTEQWVGLLVSLGVVGFAVTFALQQPLFSLIGWLYIMLKRPYQVGDRVAIEGSKGDVVAVDFLVTTLWEINGDLVSTHQPSGRIVTLPNSVVLSSHVHNYSWEGFPYVWNELSIQVAYETDLAFARELMVETADDYLGAEMAEHVAQYRERLAETPVELEVGERPSVNVRQGESWVELRLRYLVHPRRGTRVRNDLYERLLAALNEHPDRVSFPVGRNR
ncbi:mechanosensitive ion channel family protein [Halosegnis marinus]|uniref:Mechanosensitive ion channel family protein n=1 Tax=Halosegnis marinus TaxID=3034023 RepID=A0ABD5ZSB2_9EURY|nr:mechanosensitive ion channel domain-containing protein [Halosegnis sp. DT85]